MSNWVIDTSLCWSCDPFFGTRYRDVRYRECMVQLLRHILDKDRNLSFILPDKMQSFDRSEVERIEVEIGALPLVFKEMVICGIVKRPEKQWQAVMPSSASIITERLNTFYEILQENPESVTAFCKLHPHDQVFKGWVKRLTYDNKNVTS